ncbi:MAG TPA: cytochrome c oxidase subunit 4 [Acidimicrobiales bacterium]|nr:cytochrome c oxidase subunit 4 [Acidimicrobiales bacterium]
MRVNGTILLLIGVFFGVIAVVYWFTAYEDAGFLMLIGSALLGLLPGGYYLWWSRRMRPLEGDEPDATMSDGAGVVDSFPGSSIWPFLLGMGAMFATLTFIFGLWLAPIAAALGLSAVIGGVVESRRGGTV